MSVVTNDKVRAQDRFVLAIDQGTTGTTVSLIGQDGLSLAKMNQEFEQIYPKPGWVEHNPEAIWKTVQACVSQVLEKAGVSSRQLVAIGITNQRETVVSWDANTFECLHNAIVWQCRRTSDYTEELKSQPGISEMVSKKTGLVVDPYFSSSKMRWLLKEVEEVKKSASGGSLRFGTIDSYLVWKLSGGEAHVTDVSNASRTQLMNIDTLNWDDELLGLFEVPKQVLPQIKASSGELSKTKGLGFLPDGIPITGAAGDQQAALFGQTCFVEGQSKCTFGTGSFILMNTGESRIHSNNGLLSTIGWQLKGQEKVTYALEGGAFICGAAVQWLRDGLGFFQNSPEVEELARSVDSSEGVQLVPAFAGLAAPHWNPDARGMLVGMTRGTTKAHICRATLEAMALQNVEILRSMESDLGKELPDLRVDGGAASNGLLMQMQADFLGVPVTKPEMLETTSAGAAFLAGLGVGFWESLDEISKTWKVADVTEPQLEAEARNQRLISWQSAIKACGSY